MLKWALNGKMACHTGPQVLSAPIYFTTGVTGV